MTQRTLRNVLAAGAVVAALNLTSPMPAHAATGPGFAGLWSWLASSWGERVSLWMGTGQTQGDRHSRRTNPLEKAGACVDPNGCANHQTTGAALPSCKVWSDAGACVDPNG
jgi:hypothetical protein